MPFRRRLGNCREGGYASQEKEGEREGRRICQSGEGRGNQLPQVGHQLK